MNPTSESEFNEFLAEYERNTSKLEEKNYQIEPYILYLIMKKLDKIITLCENVESNTSS